MTSLWNVFSKSRWECCEEYFYEFIKNAKNLKESDRITILKFSNGKPELRLSKGMKPKEL